MTRVSLEVVSRAYERQTTLCMWLVDAINLALGSDDETARRVLRSALWEARGQAVETVAMLERAGEDDG